MYGPSIRIGIWTLSGLFAVGSTGLAWTSQTIEINLIWLLVLTFIPTSDLIDVMRHQMKKLKKNERK